MKLAEFHLASSTSFHGFCSICYTYFLILLMGLNKYLFKLPASINSGRVLKLSFVATTQPPRDVVGQGAKIQASSFLLSGDHRLIWWEKFVHTAPEFFSAFSSWLIGNWIAWVCYLVVAAFFSLIDSMRKNVLQCTMLFFYWWLTLTFLTYTP